MHLAGGVVRVGHEIDTQTVQNPGCGLFYFDMCLLVPPLTKQYHSLGATNFKISNNLKKMYPRLKFKSLYFTLLKTLNIVDSFSS